MIIFDEINIGDEIPGLVKEVDELKIIKYAGASGDFNPLHVVAAAGKAAGYDGIIGHGMLIMGFIAQAVTDFIPNRNLKKLKVKFVNPTKPGDIITIIGKITDKKIVNEKKIICGEISAIDQNNKIKATGTYEGWF